MDATQPTPPEPPAPEYLPRHRACHVGTYRYLCQLGTTFVYSHEPIGKVVWHGQWKRTA